MTDTPKKKEIQKVDAGRVEKKCKLKCLWPKPNKLKTKKKVLFKNDSSDSKESLISLHNTSDEETFDYNVHDGMEIAQEID